jgi:endo-1,4-beta-xylanase
MKSMVSILRFLPIATLLLVSCQKDSNPVKSLKDAFNNRFLIGVAVNTSQISDTSSKANKLIRDQFNSIVAENCMKSEVLQPQENQFDFREADKFVAFGESNNMFVIGHTLIWHSQSPSWFFVDKNGNDVGRDVLIERMKKHITTVVSRYKGRIGGWDVVNEAFNDDGSLRESKFLKIIGKDYIKIAFETAHAADPDAELYYNDYSMAHEAKCNAVVEMVKELKTSNTRIDGIGMQGHLTMDFPTVAAFEKSIIAFANTGVKVMVTELDLSVLPFPSGNVTADISASHEYRKSIDPYSTSLPDSVSKVQHERYVDFFRLFVKHQDVISRVTLWGLTDGDSWKNDFPVKGRTDYPLLFDRNYQPKKIVDDIMSL